MNNELYHHGIKGMKWGVRRYQNPDGTLTAAGKRRYNSDVLEAKKRLAKANAELSKANTSYTMSNKDYRIIAYNQKIANEDYQNAKIKARIESNGGLSKAQQKYKEKYLAKGMNDEEASIAAYKYDRTKKALMVCAGVSIAAVGGYAAYRYGQYAFDKTISKDTVLSRVSMNSNHGVHDAFYAVLDKNSTDKARYAGIYGLQLKGRGINVFEKKINATDNLRIASPKNGAVLMGKALDHFNVRGNNQEYEGMRDLLIREAKGDRALGAINRAKLYDRAVGELAEYRKTGKVGKNLYEALNTELSNHRLGITREFYNQLRSAGYDGVKDINDAAYSGFMTKFPVIIANASKVKVSTVRQLSGNEMKNAQLLANSMNLAKVFVQQAAPQYLAGASGGALVFGTAAAVDKAKETTRRDTIVREYRKEHPNTKLSYNEIVRMEERNRLNK